MVIVVIVFASHSFKPRCDSQIHLIYEVIKVYYRVTVSKIDNLLIRCFYRTIRFLVIPNNEFDILALLFHNEKVKGELEDTFIKTVTVPVTVTSHSFVKTDPVS